MARIKTSGTAGQRVATLANMTEMSAYFKNEMGLYSVKAYGAKGDGITVDSSSIQACINDAEANGSHAIFFPHGTYKTTTLTFTTDTYFVGDNITFDGVSYDYQQFSRYVNLSTESMPSSNIVVDTTAFTQLSTSANSIQAAFNEVDEILQAMADRNTYQMKLEIGGGF